MTVRVLGVDGRRGGWAVAEIRASHDGVLEVALRSVSSLLPELADVGIAVIGIDMPIGLPDTHPRSADRAARALLSPCGSRVFPAPMRVVLGTMTYAEAGAASRAASGTGLSRQTWHLVPKVCEVDMLARSDARIIEVHPEVSFAAMTGAVIRVSKKTAAGRIARLDAVRTWFPGLDAARIPHGDDHIDALACAWTALRATNGVTTGPLPPWPDVLGPAVALGDGETDGVGLPMRIVV